MNTESPTSTTTDVHITTDKENSTSEEPSKLLWYKDPLPFNSQNIHPATVLLSVPVLY